MPNFVIDCSEEVLKMQSPNSLMAKVHQLADAAKLFATKDIKVRIVPFQYSYVSGSSEVLFLNIEASIMEGRTTEQKATLSQTIVKELKLMLPDVPFIAINIRDIEKATYCNRNMV